MALQVIYNEIADRIELTPEASAAFFSQQSEKIKGLWRENGMVDLGSDLWLNMINEYIPYAQNVIRWFQTRSEYTLIDKLGNDANLLPPVSVFDGVDGIINDFSFEFSVGKFISMHINRDDASVVNGLLSPLSGNLGLTLWTLNRLLFQTSTNSHFISDKLSKNEFDLKVVRINLTTYEVYENNILIDTTDTGDSETQIFTRLGRTGFAFYDGSMHSINFNNELLIPYPHKGISYTPNTTDEDVEWDTVELEVNGGATEGYDSQGSLYMQDVGAVARNNNISVFDGVDGIVEHENKTLLFSEPWVIAVKLTPSAEGHILSNNTIDSPSRVYLNATTYAINTDAGISYPFIGIAPIFNVANHISIVCDGTGSIVINDIVNSISISNEVDTTDSMSINNIGGRRGQATSVSGFNGFIWNVNLNDELFVSLPHTGIGYDSNKNRIALTVSGGVSGAYDENGTTDFEDLTFDETGGEYIPNKPNGQSAYPLSEGDTFISGSLGRMNITPSYVRLYELGDVDLVKTFFDKSNRTYWKVGIEDLVSYRSESTGDWLTTELNMDFFYEYIQDAYKYQLWSKIQSGVFKDIFLYGLPLEGDNICKAKKYVGVGETYATIEDAVDFCDNDNLE